MQDKAKDLCIYRIKSALETLEVARVCIESKHYRDAINRSYYASFYAIKAVLAMEGTDFKRHKDVIAYFNKNYGNYSGHPYPKIKSGLPEIAFLIAL